MSSNPVFLFFSTPASLGPFFLRLALAAIFFYHGSREVFGWFDGPGWHATISAWTEAEGLSLSYVAAVVVMVAKIVIAISLFFGCLTRVSAFVVAAFMSCSILFFQVVTGFESIELPGMILVAGLSLLCMGGGAFSIDRGISKNLLPTVG